MIAATAGMAHVGTGAPRILMFAYHFAPSSASGTHRALHFARSLTDAGYDVRVITTSLADIGAADPALEEVFPWPDRITRVPPSPTLGVHWLRIKNALRKSSRPGGSAGDGGAGPRGAPARSKPGGLRRHVAALDRFPDAQRGWLRPAVRAGVALGRGAGVSAIIASGPPWTAVAAGARVAKRLDAPFVADFRDPWTPRSGATWRYDSAWAQRLAGWWESRAVRTSRILLFNSPALAKRAIDGFGPDFAGRVRTILNGSAAPRRGSEAPFPLEGTLWLRHFGTLYAGRSIAPLLEGLRGLDVAEAGRGAWIGIDLIGKVSEDVGQAPRPDVIVRHRPALPFSEALREMGRPAVLLVVQPPRLNGQIPTKLYDYLCTGNPVLVLAPEESATWRIASRFSRARRLDPEPSERNRAVLTALLDDWRGGRLRQEASVGDTADLTKEAVGRELVRVLGEVMGSAASAQLVARAKKV